MKQLHWTENFLFSPSRKKEENFGFSPRKKNKETFGFSSELFRRKKIFVSLPTIFSHEADSCSSAPSFIFSMRSSIKLGLDFLQKTIKILPHWSKFSSSPLFHKERDLLINSYKWMQNKDRSRGLLSLEQIDHLLSFSNQDHSFSQTNGQGTPLWGTNEYTRSSIQN